MLVRYEEENLLETSSKRACPLDEIPARKKMK
jgi:hypothetical protein